MITHLYKEQTQGQLAAQNKQFLFLLLPPPVQESEQREATTHHRRGHEKETVMRVTVDALGISLVPWSVAQTDLTVALLLPNPGCCGYWHAPPCPT